MEDGVVVRQALVVGELRAGRVVQRDGAGLHVLVGPEGAAAELDDCAVAPVLVTVTCQLLRGAGSADGVQLVGRERAGCRPPASGEPSAVWTDSASSTAL